MPAFFEPRHLLKYCAVLLANQLFPLVNAIVRTDCQGFLRGGVQHQHCLRNLLHHLRNDPDRPWVPATTTLAFYDDLMSRFLNSGAHLKVLELGCGQGDTTVVLAELFSTVYVMEKHEEELTTCSNRTKAYNNVHFLRTDLYSGFGWEVFGDTNRVDVVFVDAAHVHEKVVMDIGHSLAIPSVNSLIVHDYCEPEVASAVAAYERQHALVCNETLGEKRYPCEDVVGPESIMCTRGKKSANPRRLLHASSIAKKNQLWMVWPLESPLGYMEESMAVGPSLGNMKEGEGGVDWIITVGTYGRSGQLMDLACTMNDEYTAFRVFRVDQSLWGYGVRADFILNVLDRTVTFR